MRSGSLLKNVFLLTIIAALCGGSTPVFGKIALEAFQPLTLIFVRFAFASLVLFPFVIRTTKLDFVTFKKFFFIALVGAMNPILFFIALPSTNASVSPLIYAGVPAMTALYFFFFISRERVGGRQLFGILLGFTGVAIIIMLPLLHAGLPESALLGNILIFIAAIAFAAYGIMSKNGQRVFNASPLELVFYFCAVSMLASIPFALNEIFQNGFAVVPQAKHMFAAAFIGVVGTGVFYLAYQYALKHGTEVSAALFTYIQPIATFGLAYLFLGEQLTVPFVVGGVLAVVGAQLASGTKPPVAEAT